METAAAILVQTIISNSPSLAAMLEAAAIQGAQPAADFLRPYYAAAHIAIIKEGQLRGR